MKDTTSELKLIELKRKYFLEEHQLKMEEINAKKELAKYQHSSELERIRIKSAEVRKMQERKEFGGLRE